MLLVLPVSLGAALLPAQSTGVRENKSRDDSREKVRTLASAAAADVDPLLPTTPFPAVVISGATTTPSVVSVAVPSILPAGARIMYTITPLMDGAVIGKLTGTLAPASRGNTRRILFAARTPGRLKEGETQVALVRFSTRVSAVEIPVVAQVAAVQEFRIATTSTLGVARAGAILTVGYRLSNLGNSADTVLVQAIAPSGWRVLDVMSEPGIAVPMHGTVDRRVRILTPERAQGVATIRLLVLSGGQTVAEAHQEVEILGGNAALAPTGPVLTLGAAAAAGPWDGITQVQTLEVDGKITDDVTLWGRASTSLARQGNAAYAFARANVITAPPMLRLTSSAWSLNAGVMGINLTDLTGINLVGNGATLTIRQPSWNFTTLAASPDVGYNDAGGSLLGGRLEATPGRFSFSSAVSRLRETRSDTRDLDSWSLGAGFDGLLGGQWKGEVARRRFAGISGDGWSSTWSRHTAEDNLDIRYSHAPGGSRAFARNADELTASGSRQITSGLTVSGSYWRSRDGGVENLSSLATDGWSVGSRIALGTDASLTLTGRQTSFGAGSTIGRFGTGERAIEGTLDGRSGEFSGRLTMSAARVRRTTAVAGSDARFRREAPRLGVRMSLGAGGLWGTVTVSGQYDRSGSGIGYAPQQWSYGVDISSLTIPWTDNRARMNLGAERLEGYAPSDALLTIRAGLDIDLPFESALTLSAERNPWMAAQAGEQAWMLVAGVSRSLHLPRFSTRGTRGMVFRDSNGNGDLDPGEQGLQGVLLRRGSDVAMSDPRGSFTLAGDEHRGFEIDARSLPLGWLAPSTVVPAGVHRIAILPVAPLEVELSIEGGVDSLRRTTDDLARLTVIARDSLGREWMARRTSDTQAIFDALPPGLYSLSIDASSAQEPLRSTADIAPVRILAGRSIPPVRISLRARTLRFSPPNPNRR